MRTDLARALPRRACALLSRFGRPQFAMLLWIAVLCGGAWLFIELADEVIEGETRSIDERILLALRNPADPTDPLGPAWVEEMGRDFTALGSLGVLTLIALSAIGYLLLARRGRTALFTLVAMLGGQTLSSLLKIGFDRPRPDLVPHEVMVHTASFPSGHSMMAAVTYLTLAALLATTQASRRLKTYLVAVAVIVTLLIGLSRVYLGVHWPTDVLAGWSAGAAWAALCWLLAHALQRRGVVEQEGESER